MTNNLGFYKQNNQVLKFNILKDTDLILFDHYIKQKENLQRLKQDLPKGQFYLTVRNVSLDLNITFGKAQRIIKKFEQLNIIRVIFKSNKNNTKSSIYEYTSIIDTEEHSKIDTLHGAIDTEGDIQNNFVKIDTEGDTEGDTEEHSKIAISRGAIDTEGDTEGDTSKKEYIKRINKNYIYTEVVEYLNNKTGSKYRVNSKDTQKLIDARLKEDFKLEDFKTVIDIKVGEWLNDTKMSKFLRPQTLFGVNFESYLNQQLSLLPKTKPIVKTQNEFDFSFMNEGV